MIYEPLAPYTIDHDRFKGYMSSGWITDLNSSDSRIHKEKVIEKALMAAKLGSADAQSFLFNCYQAYNPFYTFHVKQLPETQGLVGRENPWPRFWGLLEALRTRSTSGHAAKSLIQTISEEFDSDEWNLICAPVIRKDLRCGISEKTLNKVLGKTQYRIPVFSCQLAQDSTDRPAKMKGIKRLEVKLDGVRVLAVVNGTNVTLFSRNGKEFENFPQIADAIEDVRKHFQFGRGTGGRFVLDGEIVGESFQKLMKQAHRKSDAKTDGMVYHIFDIMPLDEFMEGHCNVNQARRLEWLEPTRDRLMATDCLRIMQGIEVDLDTAEGHDVMNRYAQDAVKDGFEGIMIKDLSAPYECKRSSFWMKWKPTITVDLTIVGFEEGTGRNADRLGAIIYEGIDNERNIRVNVGTGYSDNDRDEYWASRDQLLGIIGEIEADAVTQNQDGSYSLRFPRHKRFRGFEPGDKL
jgi:DNA ligase-1